MGLFSKKIGRASREDQALVQAFRLLVGKRAQKLSQGELADLPVKLLIEHGLGPVFFDAQADNRLRTSYVASSLAVAIRKDTCEQVLACFSKAGLRVCLLKGMSYAKTIYSDSAHRPMSDIDLLVHPSEMGPAREILESLGFVARDEGSFSFAPTHHAQTYDKGQYPIDLHRSMMPSWRTKLDVDEMWSRADLSTHLLHPIDQAVMHLAHATRSELSLPLIAYLDLHRLMMIEEISRAELLERCRRYRILRGSTKMFHLLDELRGDATERGSVSWFPLLSPREIRQRCELSRPRQLLAKATLADGIEQLGGLAAVSAWERSAAWKKFSR